jgi:hypothetical protein
VSTSEITKERPFILSLIANAAIKMGEKYEDAQLTGWGMDICTKCFQNVPIESRMSIIPWIVVPATVHRTNKQFERSIHELLRIVLASQVRSGDHPDLIGGFTLMARGESVVDARGLRMLPFLANLCQSSGEMNAETFLAMMQALRFTEQLTTSEHRSLRFDNPAMSLGGVRTSAWDAAMPTEATAMALLGVTEAVNTIKNIQPSTE